MQSLAADILHKLKKNCRIWQIATVIVTAIALVEFVVIVF